MYYFYFILNAAVGLLITVLGIPMILSKVKPNNFYGFRTKKTLSDNKIWYAANKYAGKLLVIAGILIIAASVALYIALPYMRITYLKYIILNLCILMIPVLWMLIMSMLYHKKL